MEEKQKKKSAKKTILNLQIDTEKFAPITEEQRKVSETMPPSTTLFKDGMKKLFRNPLAVMSIVILLLIVVTIITVDVVCPYHYSSFVTIDGKRDSTAKNLRPFTYSEREQNAIATGEKIFPHILGTDELCRDYFSRVVAGTTISLLIGVFASILVLIIGVLYGSISGYVGGKTDMVMMRIVDIIYALPDMLIVILLSVVLQPIIGKSMNGFEATLGVNLICLLLVFALLYWVGMARLIRGQILTIRNNEYVQAAKLLHSSKARIIRKHIIPNCMSIVFIATALQIPAAIFTESYLSFVGLGVQSPLPSLGSLANAARSGMQTYPYKLICPAIMIALIVLSFNLLGDGLRDAFDPNQK